MTSRDDDMDPEEHEERRLRAQELGRSRKGKHWKLEKPRRKGKEQGEREALAVSGVTAAVRQELTEEEQRATSTLLKEKFGVDLEKFPTPDSLWKNLVQRKQKLLVRRANARYLQAIIYIAAIYQVVTSADSLTEHHISLICEKAGVPPRRKMDLLRLVARLVIEYDDGTKKQRARSRGAVSRDTLAIRWLLSQGIRPHQIKAYQKKHGGGVDSWSRRAAALGGTAKPPPVANCAAVAADAEQVVEGDDYLKHKRKPDDDTEFDDEDLERDLSDDDDGEGASEKQWVNPVNCKIQCLVGEKKLSPGEGFLILVVGDKSAPGGIRVVKSGAVGMLRDQSPKKIKALAALFQFARRELGMKS